MKYLICNLKANMSYSEILSYKKDLEKIIISKPNNLIIAPPNVYLSLFKDFKYKLCVQNIDLNERMKLTGDISIESLKSLGIKYALVGHYERRKYYHENERDIILKINNALDNNLKVIYCIGESLEERKRKVAYQVIEKMITKVLYNISNNNYKNIIIAYEPTYLIGNNEYYNFEEIKDSICFIKQLINNYYNSEIELIYGGNINEDSIKDFKDIKELDGIIVGKGILNVKNIEKLCQEIK